MSSVRKAVALISGGLDSMLATQAMLEQGIHVEGLNFYTGFCVEGHTHAIRKKLQAKQKRNNALWVAETLGIKLHIIDVVEDYKQVVINPKHGYGQFLNPCLDCKVFMVKKAFEWMDAHQFDFIVTGEVLGQRPMSQSKQTFPTVQKRSGAMDKLVRPLSAQLLAPTLPEREGWIDREKLFAFNGRSRKPQFKLAERFGITDFAQPAGGCCFLTNEAYSRKLHDLWQAQNRKSYELDDILLLKIGRHIRPMPHFKVIVGREEGENNYLEGYRREFAHLRVMGHEGPLTLIDGPELTEADKLTAAKIAARYSDGLHANEVTVHYFRALQPDTPSEVFTVKPFTAEEVPVTWHI